jgi:Ca-activated chloride channel family protein
LDLVVCLDTSRSMLARDLKPSRFERAKREIQDLLEVARGDRIALIAFSGDTRDVAPLTRDTNVLSGLTAKIEIEDNRLGGTDLGAALERALELFDGRSGAHEAVVILTDGEDLSGRGAEVAAEAERRGIRVFVVGIGTEAGGKIPVVDERGKESFLRGPDGEEVVTRLEGGGLERLAKQSGGSYRSTEQAPRPLVELYEKRIARLDRRDIEGGLERVPLERFQWPLALAVALILVQTALSERRRNP